MRAGERVIPGQRSSGGRRGHRRDGGRQKRPLRGRSRHGRWDGRQPELELQRGEVRLELDLHPQVAGGRSSGPGAGGIAWIQLHPVHGQWLCGRGRGEVVEDGAGATELGGRRGGLRLLDGREARGVARDRPVDRQRPDRRGDAPGRGEARERGQVRIHGSGRRRTGRDGLGLGLGIGRGVERVGVRRLRGRGERAGQRPHRDGCHLRDARDRRRVLRVGFARRRRGEVPGRLGRLEPCDVDVEVLALRGGVHLCQERRHRGAARGRLLHVRRPCRSEGLKRVGALRTQCGRRGVGGRGGRVRGRSGRCARTASTGPFAPAP